MSSATLAAVTNGASAVTTWPCSERPRVVFLLIHTVLTVASGGRTAVLFLRLSHNVSERRWRRKMEDDSVEIRS